MVKYIRKSKEWGRGAAWLARRSVTPVAASSNLVVPASEESGRKVPILFFNSRFRETGGKCQMREGFYTWRYKLVAEKLSKVLEKNGFEVHLADSKEQLLEILNSLIPENSVVTNGGSVSLQENGVIDFLRSGKFQFLDRLKAQTLEERLEIEGKAFSCDYYLSGVNAITEKGELVFMDGNGNRDAAVVYGPKNVILVASVNKVVKDVEEARERIRQITPMNSKRLNLKTPCAVTGYCSDCSSEERICNLFVVVEKSLRKKGRIKIILLTYESGF